jgi:hydroxyacylglutathione hydrolase
LIIKRLTVGLIQTNCYIVGDERTGLGAILDPGGDAPNILNAVRELGLDIVYVIDTHAHFDHTFANAAVLAETGAKLVLHRDEAPFLAQGGGADMFAMSNVSSPPADLYLDEGDTIAVGDVQLQILHTPGHTPGSISLYSEDEGILFSGDLLFHQGVGRTDLPGGDYPAIMRSLDHVFKLPEDTIVYSGHGPETTIGNEKVGNPFI